LVLIHEERGEIATFERAEIEALLAVCMKDEVEPREVLNKVENALRRIMRRL